MREGEMTRDRIKPLYQPVPINDLYDAISKIEGEQYQQLYRCLYLFGLRVTEALSLKPEQVEVKEYRGKTILVATVATLKNRKYPIRYPVAWDMGTEGVMLHEFKNYVNQRKGGPLFTVTRQMAWHRFKKAEIKMGAVKYKPREVTFEWRGIFPHYLRHCRASHLVNNYGFDAIKLMVYMGWSDPALAATYVKSDWQALAKKGVDVYAEFT